MKQMNFRRSDADPYIYFKWSKVNGLIVWISWIDDCLCLGNEHEVKIAKDVKKKRVSRSPSQYDTEFLR